MHAETRNCGENKWFCGLAERVLHVAEIRVLHGMKGFRV
jgi:hypothetical protein